MVRLLNFSSLSKADISRFAIIIIYEKQASILSTNPILANSLIVSEILQETNFISGKKMMTPFPTICTENRKKFELLLRL